MIVPVAALRSGVEPGGEQADIVGPGGLAVQHALGEGRDGAVAVAALIAAQRDEHQIPHAVACRALGVSRSWFYKWRGGALPSVHSVASGWLARSPACSGCTRGNTVRRGSPPTCGMPAGG